jgi:growth factor-regulated tyrosine kinase substrate
LHGTRHRGARELADAELQRAIQLSLQEVGAANGHARPGYVPLQPSPSNWQYSEPPIVDRSSHPDAKSALADEEDDPDLKAAIEASLREANAPRPSAPVAVDSPRIEHPPHSYAGPGYSQSYPPSTIPALPAVPIYDLEPLESDTILTFSQTVEQVEAQGGRDISRYPAVNELYDKANSLRPKLALSLDDASRKEREDGSFLVTIGIDFFSLKEMLSDMHDKLSQAVKLYDKLLTEQVTHPRWRSPQAVTSPPPPTSYQQANSSYSTGYNTVNGYNQWAPTAPVGYHAQPEMQHQPQSPQVAYMSAPPGQDYRTQLASQPQAESSQSQWQQQPQYAQPNQQYPPTPVPVPPPIVQSPPEPQRQSSYTEPLQYHQYATSPPPPNQGLPPVSLPPQQYQHATPSFQPAPAPVPSVPQSPPAQYAVSPPGTTLPPTSLSRHKTVSYASPPPPLANAHLGRSNTIAHQHRQQVPQQAQYVPAPTPLPNFPAVPTTAPQTFSMYAPSVPTGIPRTEERKEALLIDL